MSIREQRRHEQIDEALRSADPLGQLRETVRRLLARGHDREVVYAELEQYVLTELRPADRAEDEDVVFDVMDQLVGWCSPCGAR
jgi:hypothetical protein